MGKQLVFCNAKTCINYKNGLCTAQVLKLENLEYQDYDTEEFKDEQICTTYEYNYEWVDK